jgi:hypothetical protein
MRSRDQYLTWHEEADHSVGKGYEVEKDRKRSIEMILKSARCRRQFSQPCCINQV